MTGRPTQTGLTEYVWSTPGRAAPPGRRARQPPLTAEDAELLTDDLPDTVDEEWFAARGHAIDKLIEQRRTDAVRRALPPVGCPA